VHARSALFDLYGDHLLGRGGSAPVAALIRLLEPLRPGGRAGDLTTLSLPGYVVHVVGVGDTGPTALRRAGAALARATRGCDAVASAVQAVADEAGALGDALKDVVG
jgi:hypothetical protein